MKMLKSMKQVLLKLLWSVNCILTRHWKWRFVFILFKYPDLFPPPHSMHGPLESVLLLELFLLFSETNTPTCVLGLIPALRFSDSALTVCPLPLSSLFFLLLLNLISKAHSSLFILKGHTAVFPSRNCPIYLIPFIAKLLETIVYIISFFSHKAFVSLTVPLKML